MIASRIIGHRGAALLAPENTLAGIRCAANCGTQWIELDVTLLGDGTPVLCHDNQLDRCSNQSGPLDYLTFNDLPSLDVGSWFDPEWINEPMPHLSDALLLCESLGLGLNLEIKAFDLDPALVARKVFEEISVYWQHPKKLILSSYDLEVLNHYRHLDLFAQIGVLYDHLPELWCLQAQALQAVSIHCDCNLITADDASAIKNQGFELYTYTCNDLHLAAKLFEWGVDGIFTDNPPLMLENFHANHPSNINATHP
ncbi:glycerophosphoryl diester phosphodiesterase [Neptuniibacter caesariensis]|uniref:GP-PDE domain-containing protein n=1 Tax=Neptuniibacter caesariensis TaxID=207954 RepID=A0A7U8C6K7_NEPCE|nr:glycerophosphoryl diester phosphodiesterase [Neptuniibacter caesariensis]EAR61025.1 hypothetical protein MED92_01409 [Neptuniibacter caesariensis]